MIFSIKISLDVTPLLWLIYCTVGDDDDCSRILGNVDVRETGTTGNEFPNSNNR